MPFQYVGRRLYEAGQWIHKTLTGGVTKPPSPTRGSHSHPPRTAVPPGPYAGRPRRRIDDPDAGPRMLELFAQLYAKATSVYKNQGQVEQHHAFICLLQGWIDSNETEMRRLENETRADYTELIQARVEEVAKLQQEHAMVKDSLREVRSKLEQDTKDTDTLWLQVFENSQEYFNQCWKVDFRRPWCMNRAKCAQMRRELVDQHDLIVQTRKSIHSLKYRLVLARTERRGLPTRRPEDFRSLSVATRLLENARVARIAQEEQDATADLFEAQAVLALREERLQKMKASTVHGAIRAVLKTADRLPPQIEESEGGSTQESDGERSNSSQTNMSDATRESALANFKQMRDRLERLQTNIGLDRVTLADPNKMADHVLTFTDPGPTEHINQLAARLATREAWLPRAESEYELAQRALLAAGGALPADEQGSWTLTWREGPRGGREGGVAKSRRSTDTNRIRNLNRGPVNKYRFGTGPGFRV